jgi:glutamine synthetase
MAVILASGLDGIKRKLNGVKPVSINLYDVSDEKRQEMGISALPASLKEAIEELENDSVLKEALGDHITPRYIAAKKAEWLDYSVSVSNWELEHYLERY